jgi:hypothetical protein
MLNVKDIHIQIPFVQVKRFAAQEIGAADKDHQIDIRLGRGTTM